MLLHARPDLDTAATARQLGRQVNWVFRWRHAWAIEGFRLTAKPGRGRKPALPLVVATVKALACELPAQRERPLSRYSTSDLVRYIAAPPATPATSASTLWRILEQDALKPWRHLSWTTPRDPAFAAKAGRVLDLYAGVWDGQPSASGATCSAPTRR